MVYRAGKTAGITMLASSTAEAEATTAVCSWRELALSMLTMLLRELTAKGAMRQAVRDRTSGPFFRFRLAIISEQDLLTLNLNRTCHLIPSHFLCSNLYSVLLARLMTSRGQAGQGIRQRLEWAYTEYTWPLTSCERGVTLSLNCIESPIYQLEVSL
jgi:hypothetical protein